MYFDKCIGCGQPMKSGHRTGKCGDCRTVKCGEPGCQERVRQNVNSITYCTAHSTRRRDRARFEANGGESVKGCYRNGIFKEET